MSYLRLFFINLVSFKTPGKEATFSYFYKANINKNYKKNAGSNN